MKFVLGLSFMLAGFASSAYADFYSSSRDLDKAHTNIALYDVQFVVAPSKTEVRRRPECDFYNRPNHEVCLETVVLETKETVQVTVSFKDGIFPYSDQRLGKTFFPLNLDPETFSAAALEEIKSISKNDFYGRFHEARLAWAANNINLQTNLVTRDIQIVDVANSNLCIPVQGNRYPQRIPGCVEDIRYKPAKLEVKEVTVTVK